MSPKASTCALALGAFALSYAVAQNPPKPPSPPASAPTPPGPPAPKEFTFPAVTYACVEFSIPDGDEAANRAIDEARVRWYDTARGAGLKQASSVFIHAKVQGADMGYASSLPAEACGIVAPGSIIPGMKIHALPARLGLAGFCDKLLDVQQCLASAWSIGGFTETKPWPWLPMYARWPVDKPAPASELDIIRHLRTAVFTIPYAPPGSGVPRERSDGPKRLVECKAECPDPAGPQEADAAGKGIGWFIPLRPRPNTPQASPVAAPGG